MTLYDFLSVYGGNNYITITPYCELATFDEVITSDWYEEIEDRTILRWQTLGGFGDYKVEIDIALE